MSDQFIYLQLKFIPKIGHAFTDEREVAVEVPKSLVQRKSESINEDLREVIALDLAKSAALGTFPTVLERVPEFPYVDNSSSHSQNCLTPDPS